MRWNWEQPDWPRFTWDARRLRQSEERFLIGSGAVLGSISHLAAGVQEQLVVEAISTEALTTSEIEGELLNRESVQSSIRRALGLTTDARRSNPAERGVAEMMVSVYRRPLEPLSDAMLLDWHRMLMSGRGGIRAGEYRTHPEPMQVVSGRIGEPTVHFEAPPSAAVPAEMAAFVGWFNRTAPAGREPLGALVRAGMAHLYFESIHPFEDGNGRVGRAIAEKALAQGLGRSTLTAVAATILRHRAAYYRALEAANKHNEISDWLAWFAGIVLEAQERTAAQIDFQIQKTRLLDRVGGQLNERQSKVLDRMLREGTGGFQGGLSAANYMSIVKTSTATATRDLADMVARGALIRTGERRSTRYHISLSIKEVPTFAIDKAGKVLTIPPSAKA
jgi:Fic family protein